jgi:hypothetical protein
LSLINENFQNSETEFEILLQNVKNDIRYVKQIIIKYFPYFQPFIRGGNLGEITTAIDEIIDDISTFQSLNIKCCKYDKDCKRKECCAYIHHLDFDQMIKPCKYLQENIVKFIEGNYFSSAAAIIRNIYFLHNAVWNSLSRRTFGIKQIIMH